MTNIEALKGYFRVFELFGLQYFSFKDLVENVQQKRSNWFYRIYFIILLLIFPFSVTIYVAILDDISTISLDLNNGFNHFIKAILQLSLIATIIGGLIESYVKTDQVKEIIMKTKKISTFFKTEFNHDIDYESFCKTWKKRTLGMSFLIFIAFVVMSIAFGLVTGVYIPVFIGLVSILFLAILELKLVYYVDLLNLQLENLHEVIVKSSCPKKSECYLKNYHNCKVLAYRRCHLMIYDLVELANSSFSAFLLLMLLFLILSITYSGFECSILPLGDIESKSIIRKFLYF